MNTIQIAILLLLPMILFYQRSKWNARQYIIWLPVLYLLWYFTYGLLHETLHLSGVLMAGKDIYEIRLIPHFWRGDFGTGYIRYDFSGDIADLFIMMLPYFRDVLFAVTGYVLFRKLKLKTPFVTGLLLVLLVFSPLYDVTNNYVAYLTGYMNDFNAMRVCTNSTFPHAVGISFVVCTLAIAVLTIKHSKGYPYNEKRLETSEGIEKR